LNQKYCQNGKCKLIPEKLSSDLSTISTLQTSSSDLYESSISISLSTDSQISTVFSI
jgi:hypothetical protein